MTTLVSAVVGRRAEWEPRACYLRGIEVNDLGDIWGSDCECAGNCRDHLKQMRGRRSLTLATVAEATGISKSTLSHLEREGAAQAEL